MANMNYDMIDPGYSAAESNISRQQKYADLLRQMALSPSNGQMVSGHYVGDPFGALAKVFLGYQAGNTDSEAQQAQRDLAVQLGNAQRKMILGEDLPNPAFNRADPLQGDTGAIIGNALSNNPSVIPQAAAGDLGAALQNGAVDTRPTIHVGGIKPTGMSNADALTYGMLDLPKLVETSLSPYKATDATSMAVQGGFDPLLANQAKFKKDTYIAPTRISEGAYNDPEKGIQFLPTAAPVGFQNAWDENGTAKTIPVKGGLEAVTMSKIASDPLAQTERFDPKANGGKGGMVKIFTGDLYKNQHPDLSTNNDTSNGQGNNQPVLSQPPAGFNEGQQRTETELSDKWKAQQAASKEAQSTISYLKDIEDAAKNASVGAGNNITQMYNNIASRLGSEKATDAVTANNLMKKYQAQIVTRLSQAGMNTDAARQIAENATPGEHMNLPAIHEAVQNLVGAANMQTARTNLLLPHSISRNSENYTKTEVAFDNAATPEVFQYHAIAGTPAGQKFLKAQIAKDPSFIDRVNTLDKMGAFK